MGGKDAKSAAHIVAGMATMNRNSTTRDHRLAGSAEAAAVAETAPVAAAAAAAFSLLAGRRGPVRVLLRVWPLVVPGDDWVQPGMLKAYLVVAATEEFVAACAWERIGRSRCIGCRQVPF